MEKIKFLNPGTDVPIGPLLPDDMFEKYLYLNAKYEVCETCNGTGKTVNPSIDHYGITREQFDEDPDFEEAYFRGDYDVRCRECKGERVVLVPDENNNPKELLDLYYQYLRDEYNYARERYYEMRAEGQEVYMSDFGY